MPTEYHRILPERIEILEEITTITKKLATSHHKIEYAGRTFPIISLVVNQKAKDTLLITAGCHGNEPAPVYALRDILKEKNFPKNKRIIIVPCINPVGFCTHKEQNEHNVNINDNFYTKSAQVQTKILKKLTKTYKPDFVLNLHEDPDEKMFYLYIEGKEALALGEKIISRLQKIPIYKNKKIHSDWVRNGIILNGKKGTSFEDWLIDQKIPNFCVETPGLMDFKKRIDIHKKIIKIHYNHHTHAMLEEYPSGTKNGVRH